MSNVYAQVGSNFQQVGGARPDGFIEMTSQRPEGDYVAAADGTWVAAPIPVPQIVTRRQGRLALIDAGKLLEVEAAIAAIADPIEKLTAQVEYEADTWERSNAFLQYMWAQLGGTEAQLDDLFTLAASK